MLDSGLITSEQSANLTKIINKAKVFEEAATDPRKLNTLITTGDGVINLLARLVGSRLGSMTATGQGSPLVMAYAGSKAAQKVLEKDQHLNKNPFQDSHHAAHNRQDLKV